jgi:DNA polymerase-3 subunit gamma/tau
MFRALLKEQEDLAWAPTPFAVLEMALVRLASMPAGDDIARLIARLDALERGGPAGGSGPAPGGRAAGAGRGASGNGRPTRRGGSSAAAPEASAAAPPRPPSTPAPKADSAPAQRAPAPPADDAPAAVVFDRLRGLAGERNRTLAAAMEGGRLVERSEAALRFAVPHAFAAQRLNDRRGALEALCAHFFGRPMQVEIQAESGTASAGGAGAADSEAVRLLRQEALNDPGVAAALDVLEGEIVEIRPLGGDQ